jgi:hypothetical protein
MPELVHQPLYDEKHRYRMVGQERTYGPAIPERTGSTLTLRDLDYRKLKKGLPQNPHVTLRG